MRYHSSGLTITIIKRDKLRVGFSHNMTNEDKYYFLHSIPPPAIQTVDRWRSITSHYIVVISIQ